MGFFQALTGKSSCDSCPSGHMCPHRNLAMSTVCPAGTFASQGASTCTACSIGSYALAGSGECTRCPAGNYCQDTASLPKDCPAGQYSKEGSLSCSPCLRGLTVRRQAHTHVRYVQQDSFHLRGQQPVCLVRRGTAPLKDQSLALSVSPAILLQWIQVCASHARQVITP